MLMHGKPCLIPILKHDLIQSSNILAGLMRLVLVIWQAIKSTFDQASGKSAPGAIGLTRGVFVSLETVTKVTGDRCFISICGSYTSEIRLAVLKFKFCPTIYKTNPGKNESSEYGIFSKAVKFTLWINIVSHCKIIRAASSEFGSYRLCEQRRFRRACASAQSRQNLRCSLI